MNLQEIANDVVNTLNHNGFDRVTLDGINEGETAIKSPRCTDCDFTIRLGYWEQLPDELEQNLQEYHSVRIEEQVIEDEDCGYLYYYEFTIVDEDTGYTLNELNELDSNYSDESDYLMSVGADDTWGIA